MINFIRLYLLRNRKIFPFVIMVLLTASVTVIDYRHGVAGEFQFIRLLDSLYTAILYSLFDAPANLADYELNEWEIYFLHTARYVLPFSLAVWVVSLFEDIYYPIINHLTALKKMIQNDEKVLVLIDANSKDAEVGNLLEVLDGAGKNTTTYIMTNDYTQYKKYALQNNCVVKFKSNISDDFSTIAKFDSIYLLCADFTNLAIVKTLKEAEHTAKVVYKNSNGTDMPIFVFVDNYTLYRQILRSKAGIADDVSGIDVELVNRSENKFRGVLTHLKISEFVTKNDNRFNLFFYGSCEEAEICLDKVMELLPLPRLTEINFVHVTNDTTNLRHLCERRYDSLFPKITYQSCQVATIEDFQSLISTYQTGMHLFTQVSEAFTPVLIELADLKTQSPENWVVFSEQTAEFTKINEYFYKFYDGNISIAYPSINLRESVAHKGYEKLAKLINAMYATKYGIEADPDVSWSQLSHDHRYSSKRAADHVKNLVQYVLCNREQWLDPNWDIKPSAIDELAKCEHQSWVNEKQINGWRKGFILEKGKETKCQVKRLHPLLVLYDQLDDINKSKDHDVIKVGLQFFKGDCC